ncbi:hypothetical protein [Ruegeria sp. HKCCSP351]|nr:hypothetical protein [Ruegeria sp. HKCCSP351]
MKTSLKGFAAGLELAGHLCLSCHRKRRAAMRQIPLARRTFLL